MWSGGREESCSGEAVLLLQPTTTSTTTSSTKNNKNNNNNNNNNNTARGDDPTQSFVGGRPSFYPSDDDGTTATVVRPPCERCARCGDTMFLLLQMYAPLEGLDRTLYVFGCNAPSCRDDDDDGTASSHGSSLFFPGGPRFRCVRSQRSPLPVASAAAATDRRTTTVTKTDPSDDDPWGNDDDDGGWGDDDDNDDGGWGVSTTDDTNSVNVDRPSNPTQTSGVRSMEELEAMIAACEMKQPDTTQQNNNDKAGRQQSAGPDKSKRTQPKQNDSTSSSSTLEAFSRHDLDVFDEPYASGYSNRKHMNGDDSDEDEDAFGAAVASNDDDLGVQKILRKYLEEEEDEDIVAALTSTSSPFVPTRTSGGGKGGGGEKYERIPPDQRAFLAFTARIRRAPYQVVRYAYGGEPMYSAPTVGKAVSKSALKRAGKKNKATAEPASLLPDVPPCVCGSPRVFEFQLLPSILHVLHVDDARYRRRRAGDKNDDAATDTTPRTPSDPTAGGMNWGVIAVYSCSDSCDRSREEFVVVQASVDDIVSPQQKKKHATTCGVGVDAGTKHEQYDEEDEDAGRIEHDEVDVREL